jgi:hypothetical protein
MDLHGRLQGMFVPHSEHTYGSSRPVTGIAVLFLYVNDVRTSQEIHLWTTATCYGDSFSIFICK